MVREQILKSDALKRRFIKDCNLPLSLTDNPYFEERLKVLDSITNATKKFNIFCNSLIQYENEEAYFADYTRVKKAMMDRIKNSDGYKKFINYPIDYEKVFPYKDLYKEYNDNYLFISIDMKQANFSVLNFYDTSIFEDDLGEPCLSWEDFISQYTENEHIINSKYIRQVVLGNCNPKQQIKYEDYLMHKLAKHIMMELEHIDIYSVHNDEIILKSVDGTHFSYSLNKIKEVVELEPNGIGRLVNIEVFELHKIPNGDGWYKLNYIYDKLPPAKVKQEIELKCVDSELIIQYIKHLCGMPISENDLVFRHKDRLAKFLKEVDNPWK